MKLTGYRSLVAAVTLASAGLAHATSLNYADYSGSLGENASWSLWDVFPANPAGPPYYVPTAKSFSNLSHTTGDNSGAILQATLSGGNPGALALPDSASTAGSILYTGGATASFTIYAQAVTDISTFVLQIKQDGTNPSNPSQSDISGLTAEFSPVISINGEAPIAFSLSQVSAAFAEPSGGTEGWTVTTWAWSGLDIGAGDIFSVSFQNAGDHLSMDGFRIDADGQMAVPEPSTYALLAMGVGGVLWMMRRRAAARASA